MRTISYRESKFNTHLKGLIAFYKDPLVNAIEYLHYEQGLTLDDISEKVFKGEISKQAIQQNYLSGGSK